MYDIFNNISQISHKKCVGCKSCGDACPIKAIAFESDNEGFSYPIIDEQICVKCGKCLEICPVYNEIPPLSEAPKCYSAWSKEDKVRDKSTSGGFFYELGKIVLRDNGVVIAAKYTDNYKGVIHAEAKNLNELDALVGSKYLQSDTSGCFKNVLKYLEDGGKVLFAGTPCQCAAVRRFVEGRVSVDNLILMDFVCYSIYSPVVYRKWLEELESQEGSKVCRVRFKSKKFGWENRYVEIEFENGNTKYQSDLKGEDLYIAGIEDSNLYQRSSCFDCQFREEIHRNTDFTVGDYWGIKSQTDYDMFKGISFVIANSKKAKSMIKTLNDAMVIRPTELSDIKAGNPNMVENPVPDEMKRKAFFSSLEDQSFSSALFKVIEPKKVKKNNDLQELKNVLFDKNISTVKYVYYNYFCKSIQRKGTAKIVPYKNAVISIDKNSKLIIEGHRNINIGVNKYPGSKSETYFKLLRDSNAKFCHGADLYYGSTFEVAENAMFESGYFSMNTGTVIVVDYHVRFGEYVGFGRNNMVYDSDFHALHTSNGSVFNRPRETIIGSHVWITSNNIVLPGSIIGDNVVISNGNSISYRVPSNKVVRNDSISDFSGWWSERPNIKGETIIGDKKLIVVGYGAEGKNFVSRTKNQVIAIIDNHSKDTNVVSFNAFTDRNKEIADDEAFVICSTKYFDELYEMVRKRFPDALIVASYQFL